MDRVGLTGAGNKIALRQGQRPVQGRHQAEDARLAVHLRDDEPRRSSFRGTSGRRSTTCANFTNSKPVSSGPFNRITRFTAQDYVFNKNPHYWQKGQPKVACLEYVQASSNDAALALIQSGQVDWTHNFVPNVEQGVHEAKDKKHFHAFYATTAYPISLLLDTTKYPYSIAAFRKALSRAIDRKTVSKLGEYGYAPPTDAIGLNGLFPKWVTDKKIKARSKTMSTLQPQRREEDADRRRLHVPRQRPLRPARRPRSSSTSTSSPAGRTGSPRTRSSRGTCATSESTPRSRSSPTGAPGSRARTRRSSRRCSGRARRRARRTATSTRTCPRTRTSRRGRAVRRPATGRTSPTPRRPRLLNKWKGTLNPTKQQQIATQLQGIFLDNLPIVPLFIGPRWSTYSTKYFHCFPTKKNFYGDPIFTTYPDNILSFTRICPGGKVGP